MTALIQIHGIVFPVLLVPLLLTPKQPGEYSCTIRRCGKRERKKTDLTQNWYRMQGDTEVKRGTRKRLNRKRTLW